jgi:hypothetical protein
VVLRVDPGVEVVAAVEDAAAEAKLRGPVLQCLQ